MSQAILDVSSLVDIEIAERIKLCCLLHILLGEPYLVGAKNVLVEKA